MADWIDELDENAGADMEEAPRTVPMQTISEVLKDVEDMEEPEIVMPGDVELGDIVNCYGAPGSTKSAYSLMYALSAAAGRKFMGFEFGRPLRVWILLEEDRPRRSRLRTAYYMRGLGITPKELGDRFRITCRSFISLGKPEDLEIYRETVRQFEPDVVILDSLIQSGGIRDLNLTEPVRAFFCDVMAIQSEVPHTFVFVHHTNKSAWSAKGKKEVDARSLISGSEDLLRSPDSAFYFEQVKSESDGTYFTVAGKKAKDHEAPDKIYYRFQSAGKGKDHKRSWLEQIEISGDPEGSTPKDLAEELANAVKTQDRRWELAEVLTELGRTESDADKVKRAAMTHPVLDVEEVEGEVYISYRFDTQVTLDEE